jgi:ribulose-phosphate 3-epimerase
MNVIPVINCPDIECVRKKLEVAKTFLRGGDLIHLDVTDGMFSAHKTWSDPFAWARLMSSFPLEVHLMVEQPEEHADDWFTAGARRLVVHIETVTHASLHRLLDLAEGHRGEIMLSSMPGTDSAAFGPFIQKFGERLAAFQVLAVPPGAAGQRFEPEALEAVISLRQWAPSATIEVDGGMNPETARLVKAAGADTIVSATYIFGSEDPKKAYEELRKI